MIEIPDSGSYVWTSHNIAGYWTQLRTQKADEFQIIFKRVISPERSLAVLVADERQQSIS